MALTPTITALAEEILPRVRLCPGAILERWAEGAWPEPFCGVCRSIDQEYGWGEYWRVPPGAPGEAIQQIAYWHDAIERTLTHAPYRERREAGQNTYFRCQAVYFAAELVLKERLT